MLTAIFAGIIIGYIIAILPGPVGVTGINFGLFKSTKQGFSYSLANGLMDFVYCFVTIFATSIAASELNDLDTRFPYLVLTIQSIIVLALILLGILNLRSKKEEFSMSEKVRKRHQNVVQRFEDRGPFLFGIGIALTNLANPGYFGTLAYISINIHTLNLFMDTMFNLAIFSFAFGLGNSLWLITLISIVKRYKHRLSDVMLLRIRQFAGVSFIAFGILLGYRVILFTNWANIFIVPN